MNLSLITNFKVGPPVNRNKSLLNNQKTKFMFSLIAMYEKV